MNNLIGKLPQCIGKEIFKFLMPDENEVSLMLLDYNKHKVAVLNNEILINKCNSHIFEITRKNGKKRYYLSKKTTNWFCLCCGRDEYCDCFGPYDKSSSFKSTYIGADLNKALFELTFEHD